MTRAPELPRLTTTPELHVRQIEAPDDLDAMGALLTRARPEDPVDLANFRHRDAAWDGTRLWRDRIGAWDAGGTLRGCATVGHLRWEFHPHRYEAHVVVDPAWRRRGLGTALHGWVVASLSQRTADSVRGEVPGTDTASVRWAHRLGYREVGRAWEARLDVAEADTRGLDAGAARATAAGVQITTFAALHDGAGANATDALEAELFDLDVEATADIPTVDPIVHPPFDAWRNSVPRMPGFVRGAVIVAMAHGAMVGVAYLEARDATPDVLHQGFLGVRRAWRGRGVAQLLKRATIEVAAARRIREIRTFNDATNAAMVHVNDAAGFMRAEAWVTLARPIREQ